MFVEIDLAGAEAIKRDIAHHLPQAPSSDRVEAMARGLGFSTYAALRAHLRAGRARVRLNAGAFTSYLRERGCDVSGQGVAHRVGDLTALDLAVLSYWERAVLERYPHLNWSGLVLGRFGEWKQRPWTLRRMEEMCASPEGRTKLAEERAEMLHAFCLAEFARCLEFLSRAHRLKRVGHKSSGSYGLKHAVERWWEVERKPATGVGSYVANGMFIAAAIHMGFPIEHDDWSSPNCTVGIARRSLGHLDPNEANFFEVRGFRKYTQPEDLTEQSEWLTIFLKKDVTTVAPSHDLGLATISRAMV